MKRRRTFIKQMMSSGVSLAGFSLAGFSPSHVTSLDALPDLNGKRLLFTYGGWEGHEPTKFRDYLVPWLKDQGATVESYEGTSIYAEAATMQEVDAVIQCITMSAIEEDASKGLLKAIKEDGTGIAGWHGGLGDSFRSNTAYHYMVGGQWVAHPGDILKYRVSLRQPNDPIVAGLDDFEITSEQYYMHVDPNVTVLATTAFAGDSDEWIEGCTMPIAWKKRYGKGRVFYTALGHHLDHLLDTPPALEMLQRGIRWAAASKGSPAEPWVQPVYRTN